MGIRRFHWDVVDDCVLHETDQAGATLVTYTHEPGQFGPLLSENRGGAESYHHCDALGSTTMLTDDAGTVTDTFQYDAWGNEVARTGATPTPYTWVGRWGYQHDTPTGGYYIRARSYQPTVARWVSVDPIAVSLNRRLAAAYLYSNPILTIDPTGWQPAQPTYTCDCPITSTGRTLCTASPPCANRENWEPGMCCKNAAQGCCTYCRCSETQYGQPVSASTLFPDVWQTFIARLNNNQLGNPPINPGANNPNCNVWVKYGGCRANGVSWTVQVLPPLGQGRTDVLICIDGNLNRCYGELLITHELTHMLQLCRNGTPGRPAQNLRQREEEAHRVSCSLAADQLCVNRRINCPPLGTQPILGDPYDQFTPGVASVAEYIETCTDYFVALSLNAAGNNNNIRAIQNIIAAFRRAFIANGRPPGWTQVNQ